MTKDKSVQGGRTPPARSRARAVRTRAAAATTVAKAKLKSAADRIEIAARDGLHEARDRAALTLAAGTTQIERAQWAIAERVAARPVVSVAAVFGVGLLTGLVLGAALTSRSSGARGGIASRQGERPTGSDRSVHTNW